MKKTAFFLFIFSVSIFSQYQYRDVRKENDTTAFVYDVHSKTDTIINKKAIEIIKRETSTIIDSFYFPKGMFFETASLLYSSERKGAGENLYQISRWDTVIYHPEKAYLIKTEKKLSKYVYLSGNKVLTKEFMEEKTLLSPGMTVFLFIFTFVFFFGTLFSKAYEKRRDLSKKENVGFWVYTAVTFFLLEIMIIAFSIIVGVIAPVIISYSVFALIVFSLVLNKVDLESFTFIFGLIIIAMIPLFFTRDLMFFLYELVVLMVVHILGRIVPTPKFLLK